MRTKFIYSIWIFLIIIFCFNVIEASEQIYYPYPIIFVHGLDGKISDWDYTKDQIEKYFKDGTVFKYPLQDTKYDYFPLCDYQWQNKGDVSNIAITFLKHSIELTLKSFPSEISEDERKVIIVAHSMGGLVVRSLLKQDLSGYYASKIDKVVFIGTPHLGSPCADSVWLLNKIRQDIINPAVSDYSTFYSQNVGTRFNFSDTSSSLAITGLPSEVNNYLLNMLGGEQARLNSALRYADEHGLSGSTAIEQLRLNQNVNFHKTIIAAIGVQQSNIELNGSTVGSETFIGKASENLANPGNFKIVQGVNPYPDWAKIYDMVVTPHLYSLYNNNFTFPANLSMNDAISTGDIIVPQASQGGIGSGADYFVNAIHTEEPKQYQAILQALDDKPVIEDVRIITSFTPTGSPEKTYVIVKVKDYFLADIEFFVSGHGGFDNLNEYYDPETKTYRPYFKFKKDFLRERIDTSAPVTDSKGNVTYLHLQPGEFYLKEGAGGRVFGLIRVKNPAKKETECQIYYVSEVSAIGKLAQVGRYRLVNAGPEYGWKDYGIEPNIPYSSHRWEAYNWFLSRPAGFVAPENGWKPGGTISASLYGYGVWWAMDPYNGQFGGLPRYAERWAGICMTTSSFTMFRVYNYFGTDRAIRSAKLTGYMVKKLKGGGADFNISVYRDTSNTWPPTLDSSGDIFLFDFNTADYANEDHFEVAVDPSNINPDGNNVLQARSDISVFNCIPESVPYDGSFTWVGYSKAEYERTAWVGEPQLILIFE